MSDVIVRVAFVSGSCTQVSLDEPEAAKLVQDLTSLNEGWARIRVPSEDAHLSVQRQHVESVTVTRPTTS